MALAYHAQRAKLAPPVDMWAACAGNFKPDLAAPMPPFSERVGSFVRPDDLLLDVGGGAGRISLPLASRCREVICIDPSAGMQEVFETTVRDAGIKNARFVSGGWPETTGVEGDVALVAHVTYFVTDIVPFIAALNNATRRRVLVGSRSLAAPNQFAPFFKLVRGEELALVPGPDELAAVLREVGIGAEVVDAGEAPLPATAPPLGTAREDLVRLEVEGGMRLGWIKSGEAAMATARISDAFDDLYVETPQGFRRRVALGARDLIITWETRQ
jgi:hypothetical protein